MEPAVHYLAGDGSPPCFLYSGTFLFVRTQPEGGERQERECSGSSVDSMRTHPI